MRTMNEREGFTVVELIVVVVIIAILSILTLIAYNGVQRNAVDSGLQSDLRNGAARIAADKSEEANTVYPGTLAEANDGKGLSASPGSVFQYSRLPMTNDYCLSISHDDYPDLVYNYNSNTGEVTEGFCSSHSNAIVTTFAGVPEGWDYVDGPADQAEFNFPEDVAIASNGDIYVSDTWNYAVRKVAPDGTVSTVAGAGEQTGDAIGPALDARFGYLEYIALSPDETKLYIVDAGNRKLKVLNLTTNTVSTLAGDGTNGYQDGAGATAKFSAPRGVAVAADGTIYLSDNHNTLPSVRRISPTTGFVETFVGGAAEGYQDGTGSNAWFADPWGMDVAPNGNIYIADIGNDCIRQITPAGVVTQYAGACNAGDNYAEGTGAEARFRWPEDVAAGPDGTIYVADSDGYRVRKIAPGAVVTSVAGTTDPLGWADGMGANAEFGYMHGLDVSADGETLVIADTYYSMIRLIDLTP